MILIKNGKILTMAGKVLEKGSILIDNKKIVEVGQFIEAPQNAEVIDVEGMFVMPGIIDAHCHL